MYFNRGICSRIMAKVFKNRKERKKKKVFHHKSPVFRHHAPSHYYWFKLNMTQILLNVIYTR